MTDRGSYEPDLLVVASGADYAPEAPPGFVETASSSTPSRGPSACGTTSRPSRAAAPFKCPPAPYEGALLVHEVLAARGVRHTMQS